ncbi:MAG: lipid-binding SYLF domain-containing protein [Desulfobulbaceae bacterium]|nr:lipid-binding SYLF domain-containing protein [Desulfobulbaceae bacterium]
MKPNFIIAVCLLIFVSSFIPQQAFAIRDSITGAVSGAGKFAKDAAKTAKAILVYPRILKAGLGIGGQHGDGALRQKGKTVAYYNIVAGSYGLQIGAQTFGYAIFFMDDTGLDNLLNNNEGWEVGVGPSIVLVDEGMAKTMNDTTISESVYVFTFSQQGLMAGAGIQGSKISKINPKN